MKIGQLIAATLVAALSISASAAVRYVNLANPTPASPYDTWPTAATNIQDAVDVALPGDEVIVTNGVYISGGRTVDGTITNRLIVKDLVAVRSVNGPEHTIIQGHQVPGATNGNAAVRCVYMGAGAVLSGFTLTRGATWTNGEFASTCGGGVFSQWPDVIVSNCIFVANSAAYLGRRCHVRHAEQLHLS